MRLLNLPSPTLTPRPSHRDPPRRGILFTAFEPSGDEHASVVIAELLRRRPTLEVFAWGGARMERAGATVVERTGDDAIMGLPGPAKIREHQRINERIRRWLEAHPVALHVPVDSPSANFPICAMAKKRGIAVVHLVAPQIWAWGPWRIKKLRALTDLVLCVLPFEEGWFTTKGVPARFIGHPLFDHPLVEAELDAQVEGFPGGSPRIAIMPGSRPGELRESFPVMLTAYRRIKAAYAGACAVVAATNERTREGLARAAAEHGGLPPGMMIASARTDAIARWCDAAIVVSGTVTLQVARHGRPMVVFYRLGRLPAFIFPRFLMTAKFFALPNLVAGEQIVPERFLSSADPTPILEPLLELLSSPERLEAQRRNLADVTGRFRGMVASQEAATAILRKLDEFGAPPDDASAPVRGASSAPDPRPSP